MHGKGCEYKTEQHAFHGHTIIFLCTFFYHFERKIKPLKVFSNWNFLSKFLFSTSSNKLPLCYGRLARILAYTVRLLTHVLCKSTHFFLQLFIATVPD